MKVAIVLCLALAAHAARADDDVWVDDHTTTVLTTRIGAAAVTVRRRAMSYSSGYTYVGLTAVVTLDGKTVRSPLGAPGPTMCDRVRAVAGGLETAICIDRFDDTRLVTRWALDPATGDFRAQRAHDESPYAATAARLIRELDAAGRVTAARDAAIDQLGDSPDGQVSIGWWWDAHRLLAAWPAISRVRDDDPDRARALVVPYVVAVLAPDDDGDAGVVAAIAAGDLRFVPRTLRDRAPPIAGPRPDLTAILVTTEALLRAGSATDVALADRLRAAIILGAMRAITDAADAMTTAP